MTLSNPVHLPQAPPPSTCHWGGGFRHVNWRVHEHRSITHRKFQEFVANSRLGEHVPILQITRIFLQSHMMQYAQAVLRPYCFIHLSKTITDERATNILQVFGFQTGFLEALGSHEVEKGSWEPLGLGRRRELLPWCIPTATSLEKPDLPLVCSKQFKKAVRLTCASSRCPLKCRYFVTPQNVQILSFMPKKRDL